MQLSRMRTRSVAFLSVVAMALGACGTASPAATNAGPSASGGAPSASTGTVPGASTGGAPASTGTGGGDTPVTLSIWGGYPEMDAVYKKAGEAYHAQHPNVTVTVLSLDLRGFEQKLTTALPSNSAGDIIVRTSDFLSRFIDQGLFTEVPAETQAFVKGGAYIPFTLDDVTYSDKLWSVPLFLGRSALYYNKDVLAEAGLAGPPKTMDDIMAYARKLVKRDAAGNVERSGLSLRLSGQGSGVAEKFWIWLEQYGHSIIKETSPGKFQADYNTPDGGVKVFSMYADLLKEKVDDPNIDHDAKAFETKVTAMFVRESWVNGEIATAAPDLIGHYASAPMPVASISQTESMFVPKASPNQAAAWDFIKFMTEQDQQLSIAEIAGWLPARGDLDYKPFLAKNPGWEGFLNPPANYKYFGSPKIPEFDELETKLATHLVEAYTDASLAGNPDKIKQLLDTWATETNDILKKGGHFDG